MDNLLSVLFGPLDARYCNYFYYLSVLFFGMFTFTALSVLMKLFKSKKPTLVQIITLLSQPLLLYFINRLQYSMCFKALN